MYVINATSNTESRKIASDNYNEASDQAWQLHNEEGWNLVEVSIDGCHSPLGFFDDAPVCMKAPGHDGWHSTEVLLWADEFQKKLDMDRAKQRERDFHIRMAQELRRAVSTHAVESYGEPASGKGFEVYREPYSCEWAVRAEHPSATLEELFSGAAEVTLVESDLNEGVIV